MRARGPVIRCFLSGAIATLIFIHAYPAYAENPAGISVHPDPFWADGLPGMNDHSSDWRPYCTPGPTNEVRWFTADGIQRNTTLRALDCAVGMSHNADRTARLPGTISLWWHPQNLVPATLPHIPGTGPDGDFYFTLTGVTYSTPTTNPVGIQISPDPFWGDGYYSARDRTLGWEQYCTPGSTNTVRWYSHGNILRSIRSSFDCAVGMVSGPVPGSISLWNYNANLVPGSLPHNVGNQYFGPEGDFHFVLTNGLGVEYRYDWSWKPTGVTHRFDWSWHAGTGYTFPAPPPPPGPTPCTENCFSNVMFLPGIEGSRLYSQGLVGSENRIWEPDNVFGFDLLKLDMSDDHFVDDVYAKQESIIDTAYKDILGVEGKNIYASFISSMDSLVSEEEISDWSPASYDWRLNYKELVSAGNQTDEGKIFYRGNNAATSTPYITALLKRLANSSKSGKVTIIAHSNGGLLAKQLLLQPDLAQHVDKLIFVASPQIGTPQATGGLLHGFNSGFPHPGTVFFPDTDARYLAQSTPMVYNLLPSLAYFQNSTTPVMSFDATTLPEWTEKYGSEIVSQNQLRAFMTDASRTNPPELDLVTPEIVSEVLFDNATNVHSQLDTWLPPDGVEIIIIAGWGKETLSGIAYKKTPKFTCLLRDLSQNCVLVGNDKVLTYNPNVVIDGDDTVVESSAMWNNGALVSRYWLNLADANSESGTSLGHGDIFEAPQIQQLLQQIITDSHSQLPPHVSTSRPVYTGTSPRLHFTLHSPLTLGFTDSAGRYSGSTATTTFANIPGVVYKRFGEVQWLSVPKDLAGKVEMHGTGTGSFTIDIEEVDGNDTVSTATFAGLPSSTSTVASIAIDPSVSPTASSTLLVDENGDGVLEYSIPVKQGSTVTPYLFGGFLQPINDTGRNKDEPASVFKAGSTIPVKFQLKDWEGNLVQTATPPTWTAPQKGGAMNAPVDESVYSGPASTGTLFKYDSVSQTYQYNWSTKGMTPGFWHKISVKLDDGSTHSAVVGLK